MSVTMSVFLSDEKMLTPARWAAAIRDGGFELELDTDFDVRTFSGYLPCRYGGKEAGFEYFWSDVDPTSLDAHVAARIDERSIVVSFNTHSDMRELVSSMIASAVLCANTDGVLWDTEGNELVSALDALEWARELERSLEGDLT
jgi:hypothetical protein